MRRVKRTRGGTAHLVNNTYANSLPCSVHECRVGLVTVLLAEKIGMNCESFDRDVAMR